jgi:two-component system nitrogen regulation response regulator GlnG
MSDVEMDLPHFQIEKKKFQNRLIKDGKVHHIIGKSPVIEDVKNLIYNVADSHAPILITGESGTGKELVAQAIHRSSSRNDKPFIVVNAGAIPNGLLESELFGYDLQVRPGQN